MSASASSSRSYRTSTSLRRHRRHPRDDGLCHYNRHHSPSPASVASSTFVAARSPSILHLSASPTRVNLAAASKSSMRFSIDPRAVSPRRALAVSPSRKPSQPRRTCMCSPTTHPGSFRCSLHKNVEANGGGGSAAFPSPSKRLNARRSVMTNSLVRIGSVEGDLVKRALAALIRPSSHQQRRRGAFQPRPSRLSVMSKAEDNGDTT